MNKQLPFALEQIEKIFKQWGLSKDDWVLWGKDALILQNYSFRIGHNLDILLNRFKVPWKVKNDFQTIPPKDSKELDQYIDCIERISFGIHFIPLPQGKLQLKEIKKSLIYKLPNSQEIRIIKPQAEVLAYEYLLLHKCNLQKFDLSFIIKNFIHLKDIKKEAERKKQKELVQLCQKAIKKISKKYLIK